jgi:hypothetical protein
VLLAVVDRFLKLKPGKMLIIKSKNIMATFSEKLQGLMAGLFGPYFAEVKVKVNLSLYLIIN